MRSLVAAALLVALVACDDDDASSSPDAATPPDATAAPDAPPAEPTVVRVFDHVPQFGIYVGADPEGYTPPDGLVMWNHGTEWVTRLTGEQQARLGPDLAARVTYHAQCDNYDRIGGLFFVRKPRGEAPTPEDPRIELVRFITPFSNYRRGPLATYVFPDADLAAYAAVLADPSQDVWLGIAGGSNPYNGDPCTNADVEPSFRIVGFSYSVDLVSRPPLPAATTVALHGVAAPMATSVPVSGVIHNPGPATTGHVTVIVSGHGSAAGGVEYAHTQDVLRVNGEIVGEFGTMIDCAPYREASPDGNPGIFQGNLTWNPRNWCPGALVTSQSFPVTLQPGDNPVSLEIAPSAVPDGSYYATSIHFSAP